MKFPANIYFCLQRQAKVWRTMFIEAVLHVSGHICIRSAHFFTFCYRISNASVFTRSEAVQGMKEKMGGGGAGVRGLNCV